MCWPCVWRGVTETPAASRQAALLRNALWWIVLVVFYAAAFRPFTALVQSLTLSGGVRMLISLAFHVAYGVAGYCCFTGPQWLRQVLVFGALLANGILLELLVSSYLYSSVAGMLFFSVFSAIGVGLGPLLQRMMAFFKTKLR